MAALRLPEALLSKQNALSVVTVNKGSKDETRISTQATRRADEMGVSEGKRGV